ncbi:predicted protein [Botrytis cinerea T4]|uniref:Uncharacterized protein n=1 Tax=Botryotinia fuckeliana (strain T4) TaxID=999810 RepID=G2XWD6_BOTF4|nr:predicted protein [Botrytis cinerea T4]
MTTISLHICDRQDVRWLCPRIFNHSKYTLCAGKGLSGSRYYILSISEIDT